MSTDPITLVEPIRRCAVRYLLESGLDEVALETERRDEIKDQLARTLRAFGGCDELRVRYERKVLTDDGGLLGRLYSVGGAGLQAMAGVVRGALMRDAMAASPGMVLRDLDMCNAQPTIFAESCEKIVGIETPVVRDYVDNRDERLLELGEQSGCDRDAAKALFCRILYGGGIGGWVNENGIDQDEWMETSSFSFARSFKSEYDKTLVLLMDNAPGLVAIAERMAREHKTKKFSSWLVRAQFMHVFLSGFEDQCRAAARRAVLEAGASVVTNMHDGLIVRDDDRAVNPEAVRAAVLEDVGFETSWAFKPLDPTIVVPRDVSAADYDAASLVEDAALGPGGNLSAAQAFRALQPAAVRFFDGQWFIFDGTRYLPPSSDDTAVRASVRGALEPYARRLLEKTAAESRDKSDDKRLEDRAKECRKFLKALRSGLVHSVVDVCRELFLATPAWVDRLGSKHHLLGMSDGCYDAFERRFRPATPEDMIVKTTGHSVEDATTERPELREFVEQLLETYQPDPEQRNYLKAYLGTLVCGGNDRQKIVLWVGTGRNGRGTIFNLIAAALGEYHASHDFATFSSRGISKNGSAANPQLMALKHTYSAMVDEPEAGEELAVGILKKISGESPLSGRSLFSNRVESFVSPCKVTMVANSTPSFFDESYGMAARLEVLSWPVALESDQIDPTFKRKLAAPGLGAQMLRMMLEWWSLYGTTFPVPESVKLETQRYASSNNFLERFLEDFFDRDADGKTPLASFVDILKDSGAEGRRYFYKACRANDRKVAEALRVRRVAVAKSTGNKTFVFGYTPKPQFVTDECDDEDGDV